MVVVGSAARPDTVGFVGKPAVAVEDGIVGFVYVVKEILVVADHS